MLIYVIDTTLLSFFIGISKKYTYYTGSIDTNRMFTIIALWLAFRVPLITICYALVPRLAFVYTIVCIKKFVQKHKHG